MAKKDITDPKVKAFNEMSDGNLIERLSQGGLSQWDTETIKAILDKRSKTVMQDLGEKIEHFDKSTSKMNKALYVLTVVLIMIAIFQLLITAAQGPEIWWDKLLWILVVIFGVGYIFRVVFKEFYPKKKNQK